MFFISVQCLFAQTQPPSITSGVTFQWDGPQPTPSSPANLISITVNEKVYNQFVLPNRYELTRLGPSGHGQNRIMENGVILEASSDSPSWSATALAAFSSPNFNFKFDSNGNGRNFCSEFDEALTTDAQIQTIFYDNPQVVNQDGLIGVSTRNANSCIYIEVLGSESLGGPEVVLGSFFARPGPSIAGPVFGQPAVGADYWRSGRVNSNNGNIGIALFRLDEVVPSGAYITGVRYVGASVNHGDGKVFLIRTESTDLSVIKEVNNLTPDYGDQIIFTIRAVNNGTLGASGVQVTDLLPSGFTLVGLSTSRGSYNATTGIWNIGALANGEIETLVLTVRVNPTGNYTNTAEITAPADDPNLENNISSVTVRPNNIIVANDLLLSSSANNPNAGNALENDLLNNAPVAIEDVNIISVNASDPLVTIDSGTGEISVGSVPSGIYTITYTICEIGTLTENSNCSTATVTVDIQNQIIANNDLLFGSANMLSIGNIFEDNGSGPDLFNGEVVSIDLVSIVSVLPSNPLVTIAVESGNISIGDVPVGTYEIEYTICEIGTNPEGSNCSTAIATVSVQNLIVANDDVINSTANTPNAGNVLEDNGNGPDTFNGEAAALTEVEITSVVPSNAAVTIDPATGNISVGNVSSGQYTIEYTLCELGTDPAGNNCSTATVTVEIQNIVTANDDVINSTANTPNAGNVLEDNGNGPDTFNGEAAALTEVEITSVVPSNAAVTIDPATGNISVGNVSSGQYTIEYTLCELGTDPAGNNCSTATVTVEIQNIVTANDDVINSTANTPNAGNVLEDNGNGPDTFNGEAAALTEVEITSVVPSNVAVTIDPATGNISVGNVSSGQYTIEYTLCELGTDPAGNNCSTATVTVEIQNIVTANDDVINSTANTPNAMNVLEDNGNGPDTFNGEAAALTEVEITSVVPSNAAVTIDPATGNISVGNVSSGQYTIEYTLCELGTDPAGNNCSTATVTVEIQNIVTANDDVINSTANTPNAGNVLEDNGNGPDTFNGESATLTEVEITSVVPSNAAVTIDPATGNISVGNVSSGQYTIEYTLCELGSNSANCDLANVIVNVENEIILIEANDDEVFGVPGISGANNVINVLSNDRLNGASITIEDILLFVDGNQVLASIAFSDSENNPQANVTLTPEGIVNVAANTNAGTYFLVYSICSANDPGICDQATVTIIVTVSSIVANDDNYGPFNGISGATFGNVLENDSLNGSVVDPSQVILTWLSGNPELTLNEDASITLAPDTPSGEYILIYNICEVSDPENCDFAFVTVVAVGEVDLSVEKTSNGVEIWDKDEFDYFIRVSNLSVADATNVIVQDILPDGVIFQSQEVTTSNPSIQVSFQQEGNRLEWRIPTLSANSEINIILRVLAENVLGTRPQTITNNVTVISDEPEANLENNSASDINSINPFFIPNVITPNGNGMNDAFEVVGIDKFVKNDIVIFNRFGDHVYQTENYQNDWNAEGLVAGTYFYIFKGEDRQGQLREFKGWIQVIK